MGNWLVRILQLVPIIVSGIEQIHGSAKSGAEKKLLAMEALGLAANTAANADPSQQPAIVAATALASSAIDGVVSVYNAVTPPKKPTAASIPGAAADPTKSVTGPFGVPSPAIL